MLAIFKREFKSYLHSFIGPLVIAAILAMFTWFFLIYNLFSQSNNLNGAVFYVAFWGLMIIIPVLSMRSFTEERKNKTDQMILTAPVSVGQMVMGKFLSMVAIFTIPTLVICIFPLVMMKFGSVPLLWNYTSIFAFYIYGVALIAICMFFSSLTENIIISFISSAVVILFCNLSSNIYEGLGIEALSTVLKNTVDISTRLTDMMLGSIDVTAIIYFLSIIILFLFLTTQSIQKRRYTVSKNNFSISAYSSITVIVVIVAIVFANLAGSQIPEDYKSLDVTSNSLYTLTDDSIDVVSQITDDITLYFLAKEDDETGQTKDTGVEKILKKYAALSDNITLTYVDPVINPQFASNYTTDSLSYSSVIVVDNTNERSTVIPYSDMFETEIDYTTYSSTVTGYNMEGEITNALQYVTLSEDVLMNAYIITGHNEIGLEDAYEKVLKNDNMNISELSLLTTTSVPEDCDLLIIASPAIDYTADEAAMVISYLENGGDILILSTYTQEDMTNFKSILAFYGVDLKDGLIVENDSNHYYNNMQPYYVFPVLGSDEITDGISSSASGMVFAPLPQALSYTESDDVTISEILTSSEDAYIKANVEGGIEQADTDESGQFTMAVKAVKTTGDTQSNAAIYACGYMFTSSADEIVSDNNLLLFSNTINSLVEFETDFVTIPVKEVSNYITVTISAVYTILSVMIVVVLAILIGGFVVWFKRSKK
ncbi:MAG: Gldg family protein [Butyrivibrio sp.]|nr:Gldg family protein [Butyrivibrio sp.]